MLNTIGRFIFSLFPNVRIRFLSYCVEKKLISKDIFIEPFLDEMATYIKTITCGDEKIEPSQVVLTLAVIHIDCCKRMPESLWFVWTENDLLIFLTDKVEMDAETAQKTVCVYMSAVYDILKSMSKDDLESGKLLKQIMLIPEFLGYRIT